MIQFPCKCGQTISAEDDQAGGVAQCASCGLLNDVPGLGELASIEEDGTYKMDESPVRSSPQAAADLVYYFQRSTLDEEGNERDLRLTRDDIAIVGEGEPIPLDPEEAASAGAPRYDPVTGELIRPLDLKTPIKPGTNLAGIPLAKPALNYASGETSRRPWLRGAFLRLLSPINLTVMFSVFCMHVVMWPLVFITVMGLFFFVVAIPVMGALILSHYGNVIEEAGPFENDELPRPLRNLDWHDDLWSPFCNVFGTLVICYGPSLVLPLILVRMPLLQPIAIGLMVLLAGFGTFLVPGVMLTLQCGGTIHNLRPDRLITMISVCGPGYFTAVVLWIAAGGTYLWGWLGTSIALASLYRDILVPFWLQTWILVLPALLAGIYLMHCYCLWLGILYRAHYNAFPWILQKHVSTRRYDEAVAPPRRTRAPLANPFAGRNER